VTLLDNSQRVTGIGYKHLGADIDIDATGLYTADLLSIIGAPFKLNSGGYIFDSVTTPAGVTTRNARAPHIGVANVTAIEMFGKIDCTGSIKASGYTIATVGIGGVFELGSPKAYFAIGVNSFTSPTYYVVTIGGESYVTSIPWDTLLSFRILITPQTPTTVDYDLWLNGSNVSTVTGFTVNDDLIDFSDFYSFSDVTVGGAGTNTAELRDYGNMTIYT
jgi:hypothetical protein